MSAQSGQLDGLTFDYIRQLLDEQARPLTADEIADLLDFPAEAVHRVVEAAHGAGRLETVDGGYVLPGGAW